MSGWQSRRTDLLRGGRRLDTPWAASFGRLLLQFKTFSAGSGRIWRLVESESRPAGIPEATVPLPGGVAFADLERTFRVVVGQR